MEKEEITAELKNYTSSVGSVNIKSCKESPEKIKIEDLLQTKKTLVLHAMQKTAEENSCRKNDAKYQLVGAQCLEE